MSIIRDAQIQVRELIKLERKSVIELQRAMLTLENRAIREQTNFSVTDRDFTKLTKSLVENSIEANLLARRRVRLQVNRSKKLEESIKKPDIEAAVTPSLLSEVTEEQLEALTVLYTAQVLNVVRNLTTRLTDGVRLAATNALTSEITPRLAVKNFFFKSGVATSNFYFFENIVRTQTQLVYGSQRWEEYFRPEIDEILWGFQYVTVGDDRVRETHANMGGTKLHKSHVFWQTNFPPNGYNCRCQAVPIFEETKEIHPRADLDTNPDTGFEFNPGEVQLAI